MQIRTILIYITLLFISIQLYGQEYKILIVGNSLSYSNDLPAIIETIGDYENLSIKTECLCKPNYALIDHWDDGILQKKLSKNHYDFVVLQQGPSSQEWGGEVLLEYGLKIKEFDALESTDIAYYMVWPSIQYYHTFPGVIKNYSKAADQTNSILIPVGVIWKEFIDETDDYSIYSTDKFHPSKKGSFLAAMVIYMSLLNKQPPVYNEVYDKWIDRKSFSVINSLIKSIIDDK